VQFEHPDIHGFDQSLQELTAQRRVPIWAGDDSGSMCLERAGDGLQWRTAGASEIDPGDTRGQSFCKERALGGCKLTIGLPELEWSGPQHASPRPQQAQNRVEAPRPIGRLCRYRQFQAGIEGGVLGGEVGKDPGVEFEPERLLNAGPTLQESVEELVW